MGDAAVIGVLSDTHGFLDPLLEHVFAGVAHIVHAGDVGSPEVVARLRRIAPVTAVCGNVDRPELLAMLPTEAEATVAGLRLLVAHIGHDLMARHDPVAEGYGLVVSGHTHRARTEWRRGTLFLNPGYAGRPNGWDVRSVALVTVRDGVPDPAVVPLERGA